MTLCSASDSCTLPWSMDMYNLKCTFCFRGWGRKLNALYLNEKSFGKHLWIMGYFMPNEVVVQQVILKVQMANVDFRIKFTTTFHSTKVCIRCFRGYSYLTWNYFDKRLKNPHLQFCGFWLSMSTHTHPLLLLAACQAGMMYRTATLKASLVNWRCRCWSLKWLTAGCSFAELQEILTMVLVVVMFNISRCVPWL